MIKACDQLAKLLWHHVGCQHTAHKLRE